MATTKLASILARRLAQRGSMADYYHQILGRVAQREMWAFNINFILERAMKVLCNENTKMIIMNLIYSEKSGFQSGKKKYGLEISVMIQFTLARFDV